jgi:hypothetical protein
MEHIWIGLLLLAVFIIISFRSRESMTNKDLLDTLKTFGEKKGEKTKSIYQEPIYGPKTTVVEEPKPATSGKHAEDDDKNIYPDIYGPEITPIPGTKVSKKNGKHESDSVTDEVYEFKPDFQKAFPREDNEPQPFLTDFSKFQH